MHDGMPQLYCVLSNVADLAYVLVSSNIDLPRKILFSTFVPYRTSMILGSNFNVSASALVSTKSTFLLLSIYISTVVIAFVVTVIIALLFHSCAYIPFVCSKKF